MTMPPPSPVSAPTSPATKPPSITSEVITSTVIGPVSPGGKPRGR